MGYGGIDEVEIDEEHGFFYVHREDSDRWTRYKIEVEQEFLSWIEFYDTEIEIYDLDSSGDRIETEGMPW